MKSIWIRRSFDETAPNLTVASRLTDISSLSRDFNIVKDEDKEHKMS